MKKVLGIFSTAFQILIYLIFCKVYPTERFGEDLGGLIAFAMIFAFFFCVIVVINGKVYIINIYTFCVKKNKFRLDSISRVSWEKITGSRSAFFGITFYDFNDKVLLEVPTLMWKFEINRLNAILNKANNKL